MSSAKLLDWRTGTHRKLPAIEIKRNSDIDECAKCRSDDRPKLDSSQVHE